MGFLKEISMDNFSYFGCGKSVQIVLWTPPVDLSNERLIKIYLTPFTNEYKSNRLSHTLGRKTNGASLAINWAKFLKKNIMIHKRQ